MLLYLLAGQPSTSLLDNPFFLTILAILGGLFAAGIGAFVAIWVYRKQRTKREVSYQIISEAPIASVSKDFENRVMILLDGQQVTDARQIVMKLINTGNVAVKRDDIDEQIKFMFQKSEIIGGEVISTEPSENINMIGKKILHMSLTFDPETKVRIGLVTIEKFLLNPKESVTFTVLLDDAYKKLDVRGRIVEGKIVQYSEKTSLSNPLLYGYVFVTFIVGILFVTSVVLQLGTVISTISSLMTILLVFAYLLYFHKFIK